MTATKAVPLHFDDFQVGRRFESGTYAVSEEEIKEFARKYDPQPFHLDNDAARATLFQGLAARAGTPSR
jgi:acyl dehydratase